MSLSGLPWRHCSMPRSASSVSKRPIRRVATVSSTWPLVAAFACSIPAFPAGCEGLAIAARIATVDGDTVVTVGPVTPLDEAALEVARARMRPNGRGLTNPNRCAEAVYRHVVRFGGLEIAGLNRPLEGEDGSGFPFSPEDGPLHVLAFAWSAAAADFVAVRRRPALPSENSPPSPTCSKPLPAVSRLVRARPWPWQPPMSGC